MADPVLLTGATGLIGRAVLAELVVRAIPVHAVSRTPGPAQDGVTWHQADLLTPKGRAAVAGLAPRLIHCAWDVTHGTFWTAPANALWRAASADLVARFRQRGGGRVLAIGSCAEYDTTAPGPWSEDRPLAPTTCYGTEKVALFDDLRALCGRDLIWARLFHLYGPGEDPRRLIPGLITAMQAGQPAMVRASTLIRDYASTAHVARCLVALLDSPASGPVDIGSGAPRSLGALAWIVANSLEATSLLQLHSQPPGDDPAQMAPDLARMHELIGPCIEAPEDALDRYVRSWG
jgi:nucleoside-diphosphate-sugar epimerase